MSDKKNISIEDRGWNEMRSILDKEMPQKKKRRIVPWFLLGLFLVLAISLIGIFMNIERIVDGQAIAQEKGETLTIKEGRDNTNEAAIENTYQAKSNPNQTTSIKVEDSTTKSISSSYQTKENKLHEIQEVVPSSSIAEIENKADFIKQQYKESPELSKNTISESDARVSQNNQKIQEDIKSDEIQNLNDGIEKSIQQDKSPIIELPLEKRELKPHLQPLNLLYPFLFNPEPISIEKKVKPFVNLDNEKAFSPYLFFAGNYQSSINGLGYGVGAGLNYQLNNFGLYLEAGYAKSNFDIGDVTETFSASGTTIELDNFPIIENTNGVSVEDYEDLRFENFSNITSGISELKFNLGARKAITGKLNIDLGIAYSRLLKASNKTLSVELIEENLFIEKNTVNVSSSELYETGAYSAYDIIPHIGIEYNLVSGVFIGLNYNHGLKNLIANTSLDRVSSLSQDESIFRRNMEARIRYQF